MSYWTNFDILALDQNMMLLILALHWLNSLTSRISIVKFNPFGGAGSALVSNPHSAMV